MHDCTLSMHSLIPTFLKVHNDVLRYPHSQASAICVHNTWLAKNGLQLLCINMNANVEAWEQV